MIRARRNRAERRPARWWKHPAGLTPNMEEANP